MGKRLSDVTRYLQLLLRKEGHIFRTSAEAEIVRTIKVGARGVWLLTGAQSGI